MDASERERALERAARTLARRDYTKQGLLARLERAGVPKRARTEAARVLERAGYLDDERFARSRAEVLAERGLGDAAIRFDLEQQGAAPAAIEHALGALEPEPERAERVAAGLGGGLRAARALARRGFSEEAIEQALPGLVAEGP